MIYVFKYIVGFFLILFFVFRLVLLNVLSIVLIFEKPAKELNKEECSCIYEILQWMNQKK